MENTLKISLIIPAYNEEKYIGQCLEYILENSGGNLYEIIVVDNGSRDRTVEVAKKYAGVKVIKEEKSYNLLILKIVNSKITNKIII